MTDFILGPSLRPRLWTLNWPRLSPIQPRPTLSTNIISRRPNPYKKGQRQWAIYGTSSRPHFASMTTASIHVCSNKASLISVLFKLHGTSDGSGIGVFEKFSKENGEGLYHIHQWTYLGLTGWARERHKQLLDLIDSRNRGPTNILMNGH